MPTKYQHWYVRQNKLSSCASKELYEKAELVYLPLQDSFCQLQLLSQDPDVCPPHGMDALGSRLIEAGYDHWTEFKSLSTDLSCDELMSSSAALALATPKAPLVLPTLPIPGWQAGSDGY